MIDLVQNFVLSLSVLKIIDFSSLDQSTEYFLSQFLIDFLVNAKEDVFAACIARIGSGAEKIGIRDGLMVFLKSNLLPRVEEKKELRARVKKMIRYLDQLGSIEIEELCV